MTTCHKINGKNIMITKGAPDIIISRSMKVLAGNEVIEITDSIKESLRDQNEAYSHQALRVLAFGYREIEDGHSLGIEDEDNFIFIGLIAMIDPPRKEVRSEEHTSELQSR